MDRDIINNRLFHSIERSRWQGGDGSGGPWEVGDRAIAIHRYGIQSCRRVIDLRLFSGSIGRSSASASIPSKNHKKWEFLAVSASSTVSVFLRNFRSLSCRVSRSCSMVLASNFLLSFCRFWPGRWGRSPWPVGGAAGSVRVILEGFWKCVKKFFPLSSTKNSSHAVDPASRHSASRGRGRGAGGSRRGLSQDGVEQRFRQERCCMKIVYLVGRHRELS
jgi:hypothetical protein